VLEEFDSGRHGYDHMAHAAGLVLSCILIWVIFDRIRDPGQVTSGVLVEAAIVYLILAIAFSQLYWILNELTPRAFNQRIATHDSTTLLYFSIVTLTAMGDNAIVPENSFVRLVVGFESMVGVFYLAVIVARLVASYHSRPGSPESGKDARH
jgi:voltage-gated potassium channel